MGKNIESKKICFKALNSKISSVSQNSSNTYTLNWFPIKGRSQDGGLGWRVCCDSSRLMFTVFNWFYLSLRIAQCWTLWFCRTIAVLDTSAKPLDTGKSLWNVYIYKICWVDQFEGVAVNRHVVGSGHVVWTLYHHAHLHHDNSHSRRPLCHPRAWVVVVVVSGMQLNLASALVTQQKLHYSRCWMTCTQLPMTGVSVWPLDRIYRPRLTWSVTMSWSTVSTSTAQDWYLVNHLLLNADKSEVIVLGTANQLRSAPDIDSVQVAGASLSTSTSLKYLGVVLADFPRPRHQCRQVTQLQHSSHQTYPPSAYSVGGPDVSLQFGKQSARLM